MARLVIGMFLIAGTASAPGFPEASARQDESDYPSRVKPLLQARCYACHGGLKQRAGLRLDTAEGMRRGGDSGPAVVPGRPDESPLIDRIAADEPGERMPPEHEGEPLSADQVALLRDWIAAGAAAPDDERPEADPRDHWAFRPVVRPPVPATGRADWARNPIDAFVARGHEEHGLTPRPEASRLELLRRLSFDLIGLPPSAEEVAAFRADDDPGWYERAVDRLLSDPRHGERWGRHWMDVWRYSDWWGLGDQLRNSQKHVWHWRDWIVESLNADRPYDEMIRQMLAADELSPDDPGALRATGYLARNYFLFNRNQWMDETVEHVGKGFLGLTLNCAKCHDHKYDPIGQADYYRMRAIFEPYHVRVDLVPGETDPERDGIPRAFDGRPDDPTYRFIRGEESRPDRSTPLAPAVPAALAFEPLRVEPVELPTEAWQPERRAWVVEAYRAAALRKIAAAERALAGAEAGKAADDPASADARLARRAAELAVAAARAELESVDRRASAMRAAWERPDDSRADEARSAAQAERDHAAAKARVTLAEAELRHHRAADDKKKEAAAKEVAAAREALDKATRAAGEPGESYTRLAGARWSATRFLDSTKDDAEVTFPPRSTGRRRALADWIADRRNPLTARVAVNHVWMRHMGAPLAATVFDLGRKGSPPTHPELLDWLACELVESGWSLKHLHRRIVTSATYRMGSSPAGADADLARDPDNLRLWRRTPIRLESQAVRDAILSLAGRLDGAMGGPPVPPPAQADSTRRSLYFFHSNNDRNLFLATFDEALVKECYRRDQSIVPQQALALSNGRLALDAARPIAERIAARSGPGAGHADFARLAFELLLGAEPNPDELAAMARALDAWKALPGAEPEARAELVRVLLNHHDFVTLR